MVRIHPDPPTKAGTRHEAREADSRGAIVQLGERLLCKQEVTGSIPVGSTSTRRGTSNRLRARDRLVLLRSIDRLLFNNPGLKVKLFLFARARVVERVSSG